MFCGAQYVRTRTVRSGDRGPHGAVPNRILLDRIYCRMARLLVATAGLHDKKMRLNGLPAWQL